MKYDLENFSELVGWGARMIMFSRGGGVRGLQMIFVFCIGEMGGGGDISAKCS